MAAAGLDANGLPRPSVDRWLLFGCALAGLAGATKAIVFQLASLTDVAWQMSGEVVLMTLVGGRIVYEFER